MPKVTITQHPVGQGGMLSGVLEHDDGSFRWIYDCGSNQRDSLWREIGLVKNQGSFDVLLLSHLDSDHVSGVNDLLNSLHVKEVVLPYLGRIDFQVAIARDVEEGRLTRTFLDFASSPERWLVERGVEVVTFIHGPDDDTDAGIESALPPDTPLRRERPTSHRWSEPSTKSRHMAGSIVQHKRTTAVIEVLSANHVPALNWILAPYAHSPSATLSKRFREKLRTEFGAHASIKKICDAARTSIGRDKLRSCYDSLWNDHNLVSMSLYAGPANKHSDPWSEVQHNNTGYFGGWQPGWLSTGDANLKSKTRRNALINHYNNVIDGISVLVVPHHGSAHSFDEELISQLPRLVVGIVAAGKNHYGHPHSRVRDIFHSHRIPLLVVGEDSPSAAFHEIKI